VRFHTLRAPGPWLPRCTGARCLLHRRHRRHSGRETRHPRRPPRGSRRTRSGSRSDCPPSGRARSRSRSIDIASGSDILKLVTKLLQKALNLIQGREAVSLVEAEEAELGRSLKIIEPHQRSSPRSGIMSACPSRNVPIQSSASVGTSMTALPISGRPRRTNSCWR
jgi:hypothetical protein